MSGHVQYMHMRAHFTSKENCARRCGSSRACTVPIRLLVAAFVAAWSRERLLVGQAQAPPLSVHTIRTTQRAARRVFIVPAYVLGWAPAILGPGYGMTSVVLRACVEVVGRAQVLRHNHRQSCVQTLHRVDWRLDQPLLRLLAGLSHAASDGPGAG